MPLFGYGIGTLWSRSEAFKKKHRVGQKVRGTVIKHADDGKAWVEIDGDNLLAQLETRHPEGARLLFSVQQLAPAIILKELTGKQKSGTTTVVSLVSAFDTARTLFENRYRNTHQLPSTHIQGFLSTLAADPQLLTCFRDARHCANALSVTLSDKDSGQVHYQPWLAPDSRRQVTFLPPGKNDGFTRAIVECDHPALGLVRTEFMHKKNSAAYKLMVQNIKHKQALGKFLSTRSHTGIHAECLSITKFPPQNHGGILAEILFRT